jgi:pimeloyl-ACP methyl ester carboxylesterase
MANRISVNVDGEEIVGIFEEGENNYKTCIVACHGLLASKDSIKYNMLSKILALNGISSIRFDFRGCGESGGILKNSHITNREKDLNAIVSYIEQELGIKTIGLFGSSMGGFISILHASKNSNVNALVVLATPFSMTELFFAGNSNIDSYEVDGFGFSYEFLNDVKTHGNLSEEILKNVSSPTLIYHGDLDLLVPKTHAKRLYDNLKVEKELRMINGGDHIFSNPYHLEEIINLSVDWFKKYLLVGNDNDKKYRRSD